MYSEADWRHTKPDHYLNKKIHELAYLQLANERHDREKAVMKMNEITR